MDAALAFMVFVMMTGTSTTTETATTTVLTMMVFVGGRITRFTSTAGHTPCLLKMAMSDALCLHSEDLFRYGQWCWVGGE